MRDNRLALAVLIVTISLCGCVAVNKTPIRYYTLSSVQPAGRQMDPSPVTTPVTVGVGPIDIPDYLERPQILLREGDHGITVAEHDRWAGTLKQEISRVLVENIGGLLPSGSTVLYWKRNVPIDCRVSVDVTRLDVIPGSSVTMEAQWAVFMKDRKAPVLLRTRRFSEPLEKNDIAAAVSAIGKALGKLSGEISAEVRGEKIIH